MGIESALVKKRIDDDMAGWINGWSSREDHDGRSSFSARGSMTAPDRIWEPWEILALREKI
jgi:hypothetical protein